MQRRLHLGAHLPHCRITLGRGQLQPLLQDSHLLLQFCDRGRLPAAGSLPGRSDSSAAPGAVTRPAVPRRRRRQAAAELLLLLLPAVQEVVQHGCVLLPKRLQLPLVVGLHLCQLRSVLSAGLAQVGPQPGDRCRGLARQPSILQHQPWQPNAPQKKNGN